MSTALNIRYHRNDGHGTGGEPQVVTTPEVLDQVLATSWIIRSRTRR